MEAGRHQPLLRLSFVIASALALVHCGWIVGFESSYSVARASDGGSADADGSVGETDPDGGAAGFEGPVVIATGEMPPFGGITVENETVYWTHAGIDGGVRAVAKDGGAVATVAVAQNNGNVGQIYGIPGYTIHWLEEEGDCSKKTRCGFSGEGGYGTCGARAMRLRTDGRRLYLLLDESLATTKHPIQVLEKGCPDPAPVTRLFSDAGFVDYANIAPDLSGNRVFAVAGSNVDCLAVAGGPTIRVVSGNVLDLVADDTHLYWLTPSELHRCRLGDDVACAACTEDEVVTRTRPGSSPILVLDGETLYWLVGDGIASIRTDAAAGSNALAIVTNQAAPAALAIDASGIYWANGDGTIVRASRR